MSIKLGSRCGRLCRLPTWLFSATPTSIWNRWRTANSGSTPAAAASGGLGRKSVLRLWRLRGETTGGRRSFCPRRRDIRYSTDFSEEKEQHGGREKLRFERIASTSQWPCMRQFRGPCRLQDSASGKESSKCENWFADLTVPMWGMNRHQCDGCHIEGNVLPNHRITLKWMHRFTIMVSLYSIEEPIWQIINQ